ncbi:MAG: hypothetical protein QOE90_2406 [Thermoplasmata archaeon]|jgi:hypothetical protein|nr:hypothetical protein [Thermoplasmata archaeon]
MIPLARFRIYSRTGSAKAYLKIDGTPPTHAWVRGWRDATAFLTHKDAEAALHAAQALEPDRPMCVVMWGTRQALLPGGR